MSVTHEDYVREQLRRIGRDQLYRELVGDGFAKDWERPKDPFNPDIPIAINAEEKAFLSADLKQAKKQDPRASLRSIALPRMLAVPDIGEWMEAITGKLEELEDTVAREEEIREEAKRIEVFLAKRLKKEERTIYQQDLFDLERRLAKLTKVDAHRTLRLASKVSPGERAALSYRAHQLHLTLSDYLRRMIFGYLPGGPEDNHLTLKQKRHFYISIELIFENGWKEPPGFEGMCPNCRFPLGDK